MLEEEVLCAGDGTGDGGRGDLVLAGEPTLVIGFGSRLGERGELITGALECTDGNVLVSRWASFG